MDNRHADLMKQGFMKPPKKRNAPKRSGKEIDMSNYEQGYRDAMAGIRAKYRWGEYKDGYLDGAIDSV